MENGVATDYTIKIKDLVATGNTIKIKDLKTVFKRYKGNL
jgi:hypothetical protein